MIQVSDFPGPKSFWEQVGVASPDQCWLWMGPMKPEGYGIVKNGGRSMNASRVAWIWYAQVTPPAHLFVCHSCHTPRCCNPLHLYIGTNRQNQIDSVTAGRNRLSQRTYCNHGHPFDVVVNKGRGKYSRACSVCRKASELQRSLRRDRKSPVAEVHP